MLLMGCKLHVCLRTGLPGYRGGGSGARPSTGGHHSGGGGFLMDVGSPAGQRPMGGNLVPEQGMGMNPRQLANNNSSESFRRMLAGGGGTQRQVGGSGGPFGSGGGGGQRRPFAGSGVWPHAACKPALCPTTAC